MAITHMYGFDHMNVRPSLTRAHMVAEGFGDVIYTSGYTPFSIEYQDGRNWMGIATQNVNINGTYTRHVPFIGKNQSFSSEFGDPKDATVAAFGFRILVPTYKPSPFYSSSGSCIRIGSEYITDGLMARLTPGDHYVEYVVDFVNLTVTGWIDGGKIAETSVETLTLDSTFMFGMMGSTSSTNAYPVGLINDIYATYDYGDGEIFGRLGPVLVKPLIVDDVKLPPTYTYSAEDQYHEYTLTTGGTFNAQLLIPKLSTDNELKNVLEYTTTPAMPSDYNWLITRNPDLVTTSYQIAVPNVNSIVSFDVDFLRNKRVSGYAFNHYNSYSRPIDWQLQGSHDKLVWVTLDSQTDTPLDGGAGAYPKRAYRLDESKVDNYRYYRLYFTKFFRQSGYSIFAISHFQLLGSPADDFANTTISGLSMVPNQGLTDMDFPTIRTDTLGGEGEFGFKIPDTGANDILAVRTGIMARREQGSSEHLLGHYRMNKVNLPPETIELRSHSTHVESMKILHRDLNKDVWTQDALKKLRVVVKSKKGAN